MDMQDWMLYLLWHLDIHIKVSFFTQSIVASIFITLTQSKHLSFQTQSKYFSFTQLSSFSFNAI